MKISGFEHTIFSGNVSCVFCASISQIMFFSDLATPPAPYSAPAVHHVLYYLGYLSFLLHCLYTWSRKNLELWMRIEFGLGTLGALGCVN